MVVHDSYDELPFESKISRTRHIDRLATVATLLGTTPPNVRTSRVLEIGCSTGGNLIPMALEFPHATFVGIDLSQPQIQTAIARRERLGVKNLGFLAGDITKTPLPHEEYDYVICHGVLSWVAEEVRAAILSLISRILTPFGVASVSFNTYPGWAIRGIVRRVLLRSDERTKSSLERVQKARETIRGFQEALGHDRFYSLALQRELERIQSESDSYLFHEFLERENTPLYLTDFVKECRSHQLSYLGDARWGRNLYLRRALLDLPEEAMQQGGSWLECEEYLDDVFNTGFREAIVCKGESREPNWGSLHTCFVAGQLKRTSEGPLRLDTVEEFVDSRGRPHTALEPLEKVVLMNLSSSWPEPKPFEQLRKEVEEGLAFFGERADGERLESYVKELLLRDMADVSIAPPSLTRTPGEELAVQPWIVAQSETGPAVTNLWHETVEVGDLERRLIAAIGAGKTRGELEDTLRQEVESGSLVIAEEGVPMPASPERDENLQILLRDGLQTLGQAGILSRGEHPEVSKGLNHGILSTLKNRFWKR